MSLIIYKLFDATIRKNLKTVPKLKRQDIKVLGMDKSKNKKYDCIINKSIHVSGKNIKFPYQ